MAELSETQAIVLRYIARNGGIQVQIAGHGRAGWLSASNALVRKGLLRSTRTGSFTLTTEGRPIAEQSLADWRAARDAAKEASP